MKTTMKFLLITMISLILTVPGYANNTTEPEIRTAAYPESKAYTARKYNAKSTIERYRADFKNNNPEHAVKFNDMLIFKKENGHIDMHYTYYNEWVNFHHKDMKHIFDTWEIANVGLPCEYLDYKNK